MYRINRSKSNYSCCPFGYQHDGLVNCYYFGNVTLEYCSKCTVRKDKNIVRKSKDGV